MTINRQIITKSSAMKTFVITSNGCLTIQDWCVNDNA